MTTIVIRPDQALPQWHDDIAGIDEAGRGPLAGPLVVAAVILPKEHTLHGLNDSKQISETRRESLFDQIKNEATDWSIIEISSIEIDSLNIFQATLTGMHQSIHSLKQPPQSIWVDGKHCPPWSGPSFAIIKGDARAECISAASILAKVHRDRIMKALHEKHPQYGFDRHKGYPTALHLEKLKSNGPSPFHRFSYKPVKEMLEKQGQDDDPCPQLF